jgi:uncharacterized protein YjbJ (UPF0337 family)
LKIYNTIGKPDYNNSLNTAIGINEDIINTINGNFNKAVKEVKNIALDFKGSNYLETCKNIWDFLKKNITYKKDPTGYQLIKLPRRFLADRYLGSDCKSFSLFTAAVLKNIYPEAEVFLRYAGYSSINIPTHVYTILKVGDKKIIIDAVYNKFNKEKEYKYKRDYKMKIYTLSGITDTEVISGRGRIKAAIKKATGAVKAAVTPQQQANQTAPKRLKDKIKAVVKKTIQGGKKIGFAPARASFLGLVEINAKGLASKLNSGLKQDPTGINNIWTKLGGDPNQLKKSIANGKSRKAIGDIEEEVGAVGAAAATAVVTAAPVIMFFLDLLKKLKQDPEMKEGSTLDSLSLDTANNLSAEGVTPDEIRQAADTTDTGDSGSSGMSKKTMLMIGGVAAVALFLMMKKKK